MTLATILSLSFASGLFSISSPIFSNIFDTKDSPRDRSYSKK